MVLYTLSSFNVDIIVKIDSSLLVACNKEGGIEVDDMGSLCEKHGIFVTLTSWGILYVGSIVEESCLFIHILLIYERVCGEWSSSSSQRFSIKPSMRSLIVGIVSSS
jgi:hypothetical protein